MKHNRPLAFNEGDKENVDPRTSGSPHTATPKIDENIAHYRDRLRNTAAAIDASIETRAHAQIQTQDERKIEKTRLLVSLLAQEGLEEWKALLSLLKAGQILSNAMKEYYTSIEYLNNMYSEEKQLQKTYTKLEIKYNVCLVQYNTAVKWGNHACPKALLTNLNNFKAKIKQVKNELTLITKTIKALKTLETLQFKAVAQQTDSVRQILKLDGYHPILKDIITTLLDSWMREMKKPNLKNVDILDMANTVELIISQLYTLGCPRIKPNVEQANQIADLLTNTIIPNIPNAKNSSSNAAEQAIKIINMLGILFQKSEYCSDAATVWMLNQNSNDNPITCPQLIALLNLISLAIRHQQWECVTACVQAFDHLSEPASVPNETLYTLLNTLPIEQMQQEHQEALEKLLPTRSNIFNFFNSSIKQQIHAVFDQKISKTSKKEDKEQIRTVCGTYFERWDQRALQLQKEHLSHAVNHRLP